MKLLKLLSLLIGLLTRAKGPIYDVLLNHL